MYFGGLLCYTIGMIDVLLWQVRTAQGITLRELEQMTGLSKSTLNRLENGQTSPTLAQLERLAAALNCNITDLFAVVKR